jgi:hypothetical protein
VGESLGYPECCVDFYIDFLHSLPVKDGSCIKTFINTKSKPHFHANNIFNFQSRASGSFEKVKMLNNLNASKSYSRYFLISHIPCSYDCSESVAIGRELLKVIKAELPNFADEIVSALNRPFLLFDDFNWIAFNGAAKNKSTIEYEGIFPVRSLYPDDAFKNGNKVVVQKDEIQILTNDEITCRIKKKDEHDGVIIDFT